MKNLELKLEIVSQIVQQAAIALKEIYSGHAKLEISIKDDTTPVTNADLVANNIIVTQLRKYFPEIPVISEEEPIVCFAERRQWAQYWLVDPLDGTAQFINRTGEFSINVALIENGEPVLGVVSVPAKDLVYFAIKGSKAFKQHIGQLPQEIKVQPFDVNLPLTVIGGHSITVSQRVLDALEELEIDYKLTKYGSSLKICKIAEGAAHLYPRLEKNCEWDTAAGHCILNAAGGQMIDLKQMDVLKYNTKSSLISQEFVACAPNLDKLIGFLALHAV
jgi:3'(2'), 5'-bisphosphate nucleotidase